MSPHINPPWRPLPPIEPPRPTTRQRLKRMCDCARCYRRLQCDRCSVRSRADGLLVCAVIQIVLAIASIILSTVKVIICGISNSVVWTYAFFLMMIMSGSTSAHFVRSKSESRRFASGIVFVSLTMITVTVLTLHYISNSFIGYRHPEQSTPKDHFCHDGHTWMAYINVHYITMYFVEVSGAATAMAQGIIAFTLVIKRWRLCPRRQGSDDAIMEDQAEDEEYAQSDSESENDPIDRALEIEHSFVQDRPNDDQNAHIDERSRSGDQNGHADGHELHDAYQGDVSVRHDLLHNFSRTCPMAVLDDDDDDDIPQATGYSAGYSEDNAVDDPSGPSDDYLIDDDDLQHVNCDDDTALIVADDEL